MKREAEKNPEILHILYDNETQTKDSKFTHLDFRDRDMKKSNRQNKNKRIKTCAAQHSIT